MFSVKGNNKSSLVVGLLFSLAVWGMGCAPRTAMDNTVEVASAYTQVQRVLEAKCTGCHSGPSAPAGLRLDSWQDTMAGSAHGEAVIPFDVEHSLLVKMTTRLQGGVHPVAGEQTLSLAEVALVTQWIEAGAPNEAGRVMPMPDPAHLLFACNQDAALVSIIDMASNVVVRTVDLQALGFSAKAKPHHAVAERDGSFWYLSLIGDNTVLKFNRDNELVAQAAFEAPGMLALHPTEDLLYVGRSMSAVNPPQRVGIVRRSDMSIEEVDVFFPRPHALVVSKDGSYAFTSSLSENQIASIDTGTEKVELTPFEGDFHAVAHFGKSPDGKALAAGEHHNKLLFFDVTNPPVVTLTDVIEVGAMPWHPVYTPDGQTVYIGNKGANTVTVVDVASKAIRTVIEGNGLAEPHGAAVSPDGRYVYISNNNVKGAYTPRHDFGDNARAGTVVVIDTATERIVKVIEVGANTTGLGTALR